MSNMVPLWKICHSRSGDKGDKVDIGLFAYDAETYTVLKQEVKEDVLQRHFSDICEGSIEIFPLDNILALKIVLHKALSGGASTNLRMDNLGKNVAARLLSLEIQCPSSLPRLT